jgi:hypothetical protein
LRKGKNLNGGVEQKRSKNHKPKEEENLTRMRMQRRLVLLLLQLDACIN